MSKPIVICACAKDEDSYLQEWLDYHLDLGFDAIHLCDNNDDARLEAQLADDLNAERVKLHDYRGARNFQLACYNHFITTMQKTYAWCAFIDVDEFITLPRHTSIGHFLETVEEEAVYLNWMIISSENRLVREPGGVLDRFKTPIPLDHERNRHIKSILRGGIQAAFVDNPHNVVIPDGRYSHAGERRLARTSPWVDQCRFSNAYIRHYYTKSYQEWRHKVAVRKWPDATELEQNRWWTAFQEYAPCEAQRTEGVPA